ncbi:hypothetical protein MHLP_04440 [Candidatus Mycoplasma haematolamae str. Purdue]|uniref:Uncharacterized protein n=1 Tax=Mycoplasma haematolamae (strain Purdue) TaxID=1212765 RepID=I7BKP7_MYCHA|nr:hypothetical protein [Candidatus Mycoplasma haematolamae]AFO52468.1 hypothetical protein MHLP_04440 [Candidatus Mycoplasma haematolamae str. Purdue]
MSLLIPIAKGIATCLVGGGAVAGGGLVYANLPVKVTQQSLEHTATPPVVETVTSTTVETPKDNQQETVKAEKEQHHTVDLERKEEKVSEDFEGWLVLFRKSHNDDDVANKLLTNFYKGELLEDVKYQAQKKEWDDDEDGPIPEDHIAVHIKDKKNKDKLQAYLDKFNVEQGAKADGVQKLKAALDDQEVAKAFKDNLGDNVLLELQVEINKILHPGRT